MELRSLRAFIEVVRLGGFSRAATTLYATQSAISKAVKNLEDELGMPLLERSGRTIRLTDAGEVVFRRAESIIAQEANIHEELEELKGQTVGTLRLGLPLITSISHFSEWFVEYRRRFPGLNVTIVEDDPNNLERRIRVGDLHLAVATLPISDDFDSMIIRYDTLSAVVAEGHPLAAKKEIPFCALAEFPLILSTEITYLSRTIMDTCRECNFSPKIAAQCGQVDSIIALAAGSFGVGLLPTSILTHKAGTGTKEVLITRPNINISLGLYWRKGGYLPFAARAGLSIFPLPEWT